MKFLLMKRTLMKLCDGNEADDVQNAQICVICNDTGKYNELWSRCTGRGVWAQSESSSQYDASN